MLSLLPKFTPHFVNISPKPLCFPLQGGKMMLLYAGHNTKNVNTTPGKIVERNYKVTNTKIGAKLNEGGLLESFAFHL